MLSEKGLEVKRKLEQFNQEKRRLRNLQAELESWKRMDGVLKSAPLEMSVSGGERSTYAQKRLCKIEALEEKISRLIDTALELEDAFLADIETLDPLSQNLLIERYMTGKPLKRIVKEFNYSDRQIFRFYDKSFEKIAKKDNEKSKLS